MCCQLREYLTLIHWFPTRTKFGNKSSNSLFHVIFLVLLTGFRLWFLFLARHIARVTAMNTSPLCLTPLSEYADFTMMLQHRKLGPADPHLANSMKNCLLPRFQGHRQQFCCSSVILSRSLSLTCWVLYTTWAVSNSFLLHLQRACRPDGNPTLAAPSSSLVPLAQSSHRHETLFNVRKDSQLPSAMIKLFVLSQNFPSKASLEPLCESFAFFFFFFNQLEIGHIFTKA